MRDQRPGPVSLGRHYRRSPRYVVESLEARLLLTTFSDPLGGIPFRNYGIASYVDVDPSSTSFADYRGGPYTYDGSTGIDFAFGNFTSMDEGTPVMAAEAGTVIATADGNYDRNTAASDAPDNYVIVNSGNGYQEIYSHLRTDSVGVQVGQQVVQGQVIGLVGSSGDSTAPGLQFEVDDDGAPVETYETPQASWQNPLPYQGDVDEVTASGITNYDPSAILNAKEQPPSFTDFGQESGQQVYAWFKAFTAANESASITFYKPDGSVYSNDPFNTGSMPVRGGYWEQYTNLPQTPDLGTWQAVFTVNGTVLGDDPFTVTATGAAGAIVSQGSTFVVNERTTPIDGGTYSLDQSASTLNFTIKNFGTSTLTLGTPSLPAGWIATTGISFSLAPGASTVLGVAEDTSVAGYRYGWVTIPTNDPNAPDYTFSVSGTVNPSGSIPAVSVYSRDAAANEIGLQPGVFLVNRTGNTSLPLTVHLNISGTATNGVDYNAIATTVTIPAGESEASVIVTPIDDAATKPAETVVLSLASSSAYTSGPVGSATVTIAAADSSGTASISGTVYLDQNSNTYRDSGEPGLAGVSLFLDTNSDGVREANEPMVTTNASGSYTFTGLAAGSYNIRQMSGSGYVLTTPVGSYTVANGQALMGVDLGAFPSTFTGTIGSDTFAVSPGATAGRINIDVNGMMYSALRSQVPTFNFIGDGGNDTLEVDLSGGGPYTTQTVTFNGGGGTDGVAVTSATVTVVGNQQLSSLSATDGQVNLGDNSATVNYGVGNPSPISAIKADIISGYNNGSWNGTGIASSAAATNSAYALGYADGSTDSGTAANAGQVLIKYTLVGDANLDGAVNLTDLLALLNNYGQSDRDWAQGDFNYDGTVNLTDLLALLNNYGQSSSVASVVSPATNRVTFKAQSTPFAGEPLGLNLAGSLVSQTPNPNDADGKILQPDVNVL